ncbi:MAG: hypothetical protein ABL889_21970, partial [Terricaulis sp.]
TESMKFNTVLLPTDFSKHADAACAVGVEMAARSKAVEMTLERGLDYAEAQLLWELLRRLIVSMIPANPT